MKKREEGKRVIQARKQVAEKPRMKTKLADALQSSLEIQSVIYVTALGVIRDQQEVRDS